MITPEPYQQSSFDVQTLRQWHSPCVYSFVEISTGRVLYVGSSRIGMARFADYAHGKVSRLDPALHRVDVEWMGSIADAEIREADLIWQLRPPWNVRVFPPLAARVRAADAERRRAYRAANPGASSAERQVADARAQKAAAAPAWRLPGVGGRQTWGRGRSRRSGPV